MFDRWQRKRLRCVCLCLFFWCVRPLPDRSSRLRWQSTAGQYLETHYWQNLWRNILWVHETHTHTRTCSHTRSHSLWLSHFPMRAHTQICMTRPAARDSADIITQMSAPWGVSLNAAAQHAAHTDVHSGGKKKPRLSGVRIDILSFVHRHYYSSLLMSLFVRPPSVSETATYRRALSRLAGKRCRCFPLPVTSGTLWKWPLRSSFWSPFSITDTEHTYLWPLKCRGRQLLMIPPTSHCSFPCITSLLSRGETASDSRVRLNRSVLRCNLNAAFLGSPLSVSPLLPWLPVKSLLCLFVAKLCVFLFFPPRRLCV